MEDLGGEMAYTPRGFLKIGYLLMVEEGNVIGSRVMDEYCRFLAARRYGKPAAEIRRELERMDKSEAIRWIEETYGRFVRDDWEIVGILERVKKG